MGVDQTEPGVPADAVGRRVSCGGERATVRYVGQVPPTAGLWLGVEWDNPERGKHDGSHNGVQYFTCRDPKGGSFVRPAKVSFGVDYLTAVQQVYQIDSEEVLSEEISISSKKLKWGSIKERSFESLPSVLLSRREVNGSGADGEVRKTTPNVQWLDLSGTLLSCWEDVAAITQQLDKLQGLQLSNNRLRLPSDPSAHGQAFCSLRVLALNGCDLTWPQILECAPMWPQLEDLCVEENNITELQRPEGVLQSLKSLSLSCNPVVRDSVLSIAALPRLEQLNLSKTELTDIRFDDAAPGAQTAMFPALKNLNLDHNNITEVQRLQDRAFQSIVTVAEKKYRSSLWEKSKKFAEQAAAIVCLRVLGIPEGRIGEADSGLVCKRKREGKMNGTAEEEGSNKRHVADIRQETDTSKTAAVANGDHRKPDTPPERP